MMSSISTHQAISETAKNIKAIIGEHLGKQYLYKEGEPSKHYYTPHLKGSGHSVCSASLIQYAKGLEGYFHLFITDQIDTAAYIENDLNHLLPEYRTFLFPPSYKEKKNEINDAYQSLRTEALYDLHSTKGKKRIWVAPIHAIMEPAPSMALAEKTVITIKVQQSIDVAHLMSQLQDYHFEVCDFVTSAGQIAKRGGIVDIFSYSHTLPYRIELVDDMVLSLRTFQPETQLTEQKLSSISILPPTINATTTHVEELWKYLPEKTCIWMDRWMYCREKYLAENHLAQTGEAEDLVQKWESVWSKYTTVELSANSHILGAQAIEVMQESQPVFNRKFDLLMQNLQSLQEQDYTLCLSYANAQQYERLSQIWEDLGLSIELHPIPFSLRQGFIDHTHKMAIYTDHEIFNRYHHYKLNRVPKSKKALSLKDVRLMQPGDYITHVDHGVGIFSGLQKIEVGGSIQEAIRIVFKDNDVLYVNIHSLHKIAKYSSRDGHTPKIHKLGSDVWSKLKEQTKRKVKAIAFDLIKLYASRKKVAGFAHQPDNYLQNELEASFLYEETPDQAKAIRDVKKDMESESPMDRLICGDVGFGKTEVAIRAAFKSILNGKQVAILVPTTVLAFQHYNSFKERMKFFSPSIDFLNRFKTAREKKEIKEKLKEGKIDIIIGTQALLAKDIVYKDLGLLIIDEEQKFGVSDKEKLKTLRLSVDCLTLTATPIPRTLQFSLMGARDLSIIQTPPPNRQATHTESMDFDIQKIKDIIEEEIGRGGQVFFIHNKVEDIHEIASLIKVHCSGVEVDHAHGKLAGHELEEKILAFVGHEVDVLVCTNIVESGLDIPNANTIIINNAHQFGLSDLHQLRGRVGRSNKKSYCYLITPPLSSLSNEQQKRIEIIEEFSELGSGFQISMRDLDLRGAGDILGGEQSGFIEEIGFEMYQKIIGEAVSELKENEFKGMLDDQTSDSYMNPECSIETDLEIYIPDTYISSGASRIAYYRKINECKTDTDIAQLQQAMVDIFGELPAIVYELFVVVQCRRIASTLGFDRIVHKNGTMTCHFIADPSGHYFKSDTFGQLLDFMQTKTRHITLKQKSSSAFLVIEQMDTIGDVHQILLRMREHRIST